MGKIGIIDGDSLCYISSRGTIEESISNIDSLLQNIINYNNITEYYLFLSIGSYFRHKVNTEYKNNRPKSELKYLSTLKYYLIEQYGAQYFSGIEADDMIAFTVEKFKEEEKLNYIICTIDKDVSKQISGNNFNYKKFQKSYTSPIEAFKFLFKQCLTGDSTDNIKGINGIGEVKASNIVNSNETKQELISAVLKEYLRKYNIGEAIFNFQKTFRQIYLLRTEEDFINELGYIPNIGDPVLIVTN